MGITVCVQAMRGARRLTAEVAYVRAVFGEMDREPVRPWPLEPSIVVKTSPGRCHCYRLTLAEAPLIERDFHGIMMRVCETYGSDPSAKDHAHTLRLPGTWNLKPDRPRHLCRIVRQSGARYSRDELLTAFPRERPCASDQPRPKWNGSAPRGPARLASPLSAIPADDYGDWLRVGMALRHESGGGAGGLTLWDQWSASSPKWSAGVCAEKWSTFVGRTGGLQPERSLPWLLPTAGSRSASSDVTLAGLAALAGARARTEQTNWRPRTPRSIPFPWSARFRRPIRSPSTRSAQ
jgi:hypothetical protein